MFEIFTSNIWIIAPAVWTCFAAYAVWYSTRAKNYAPLTSVEARQLWTIHLRNANCDSKKWRKIIDRGRTVGFECGCGHKHMQKRLLVSNAPNKSMSLKTKTFGTSHVSRRPS